MPPFIPNEYLFETHKGKSQTGDKWEIFAWAVRDAMCKASGLTMDDKSKVRDSFELLEKVGLKDK